MEIDRLGQWSARVVVVIGAAYVVVLGWGVATFGLTTPIGDPILAIMEVLTVASALAITTMVAAVSRGASAARRIFGDLALTFCGLFADTTTIVHGVMLTAGRQTGQGTLTWPSVPYAAELVAWDGLLGVALLFVALTFDVTRSLRAIRRGFLISGALCLAGLVGPAMGTMELQRIGIAGYAILLPLTCVLLAREFHRRVLLHQGTIR